VSAGTRPRLALAAPFLVGIAALRGLTATLPIFHTADELNYHLPTIRQFASQLPFPDLGHYVAAQTPLFHLLMAYIGKVIGYELWRLRLVEALISYGLALAVYSLLWRRLRIGRTQSLALTVLFVLSPYVYGTSFRLLTDNLALLFSVLTLERLERFREDRRVATFGVACICISAAILTRQSTAFLLPIAGLYALRCGAGVAGRAGLLALTGIAAVPAGVLFLSWHGLVPPGGDPSSCGLCPAGRAGAKHGGLVVQTPELALATIGLYGAVLFGPGVLRALRGASGKAARGPVAVAALGAVLLLAFPARPGAHAAGVIWSAARHLPAVDGTSLLFWALVPFAGVVLWFRVRVAPRAWPVLALLGCFLVGALVIRYPWQKYVDPYSLLVLLLTVRRDEFARPRELAAMGLLAAGFVAYTLSFVV
jgi:hypothetical protein